MRKIFASVLVILTLTAVFVAPVSAAPGGACKECVYYGELALCASSSSWLAYEYCWIMEIEGMEECNLVGRCAYI